MTADCVCGHRKHHHAGNRGSGVCCTITIAGPATPQQYWGAAAELHLNRSMTYCDCSAYQPATGDQVEPPTTNSLTH